MSRWLTVFLLIGCYCMTCFKAERTCQGFHGASLDVPGGIGKNISLACSVPRNCTRGYWKYDDTINPMWLLPDQYSGDTYVFNFSSSQGQNPLHIYNMNGCVAGVYSCLCDDQNGTRTTHACFTLSERTVQCPMRVKINNTNRVFYKCIVTSKMEMIDVNLTANITIKCDGKVNSNNNCSQLSTGKRVSFTVNQSHHLCSFRCIPKGNSKHTCQTKWITLNVMDDVTSLLTETTSATQTSNYITTKYKSSSVRILTTVSSPLSFSSPSEQDTTTINKRYNPLSPRSAGGSTFRSTTMITGTSIATPATSLPIFSGNSVSSTLKITTISRQTTILPSTISTKVEDNICENFLSGACTHVETTSAVNVRGSTMPIPDFSNRTLIIVISCIVLVFAIIIVILCVHITFYKIGIRSCNDKEEWVNPIYESADNGAQLPIVIPDGGNPYDVVNSPRQVADFSNAVSTTNNVHQINADVSSKNEIPMVQVEASQNVAVKLLDYTVTASNVGSMKLAKPRCKKIEKSPTATETLSLPEADEISSPPASPHLYEMLNDSVRS